MKKLHDIQLNILRTLLFARSKRYSEIKPYDMEGSQFKFHMDKLIDSKYIVKQATGLYSLTTKGKEFANQMDSIEVEMKKQSKVTAKICCVRDDKSEPEYLLYERKKNPFYGHQGFPTSKIWYGNSFIAGAKEGLFNETNLEGEPELVAIRHYTVYTEESRNLLEDKTMYIFRVLNPEGELKSKKDGLFTWTKQSKVTEFVKKPLPEFKEVHELLQGTKNSNFFKEVEHIVDIDIF